MAQGQARTWAALEQHMDITALMQQQLEIAREINRRLEAQARATREANKTRGR
ncbi:MAG: hypothetical protein LC793_16305 [Thermomicrobia bacterium]|nr:hypothetical protein [Thermomicrobia bacterium]MCA1723021.1 hypothetical protein [Thermomicrobia bacterium]